MAACIRQVIAITHTAMSIAEPLDPVYRGCTSNLPIKIRGSNHNSTQVLYANTITLNNKHCDVSIQSPELSGKYCSNLYTK